MDTRTLVTLTEEEVNTAIKEYVKRETGLEVKKLSYDNSSRGEYSKGNFEEFVKSVTCKCDVKIK